VDVSNDCSAYLWVWGGLAVCLRANWSLFENGVNDFAGGIVVHQTAGLAALIVALSWSHGATNQTTTQSRW
jgi:ammonia channel protein AmtB